MFNYDVGELNNMFDGSDTIDQLQNVSNAR